MGGNKIHPCPEPECMYTGQLNCIINHLCVVHKYSSVAALTWREEWKKSLYEKKYERVRRFPCPEEDCVYSASFSYNLANHLCGKHQYSSEEVEHFQRTGHKRIQNNVSFVKLHRERNNIDCDERLHVGQPITHLYRCPEDCCLFKTNWRASAYNHCYRVHKYSKDQTIQAVRLGLDQVESAVDENRTKRTSDNASLINRYTEIERNSAGKHDWSFEEDSCDATEHCVPAVDLNDMWSSDDEDDTQAVTSCLEDNSNRKQVTPISTDDATNAKVPNQEDIVVESSKKIAAEGNVYSPHGAVVFEQNLQMDEDDKLCGKPELMTCQPDSVTSCQTMNEMQNMASLDDMQWSTTWPTTDYMNPSDATDYMNPSDFMMYEWYPVVEFATNGTVAGEDCSSSWKTEFARSYAPQPLTDNCEAILDTGAQTICPGNLQNVTNRNDPNRFGNDLNSSNGVWQEYAEVSSEALTALYRPWDGRYGPRVSE